MNPGSSSPATKPNTSKVVAAAAEALTAKARENTYTINPPPSKSPEKSLIKGHKRLESLQNGNLRNKNSYTDALRSLDRASSPEKSPERTPRTPGFDWENRSPEKGSGRSSTPTPAGRDSGRETPSMRPSRPPLKAILGENTPSSATLLALQNMTVPKDIDTPLADITNSSNLTTAKPPQDFHGIESSILSLTAIATNLQKEMTQLSRRSKDNATDLISLKEATNSRDEDIRKSLKDLTLNLSSRLLDPEREHGSRATSSFGHRPGSFMLDSKPHNFENGLPKSYSLPRMGSPGINSSELSGSSYYVESAASIALLEKILREMGTKEGQEGLACTLAEMKDMPKSMRPDPVVSKKLEEILNALKDSTGSRALVPRRDNGNGVNNQASKLDTDFDAHPAPLSRASRELTPQREGPKSGLNPKAADFVNEDLQKLLKKMKDSITEGGGMTAEVKAHLRELRGEVLGMGRDIARKLDQAESTTSASRGDAQGPGREEIAQIVQDGLHDLKDHMEALMRERRRQSSSSTTSRRSVDSGEVYNAVKNALVEMPLQQQLATQHHESGIEREEILEAVREAWETYKPEIELQTIGLERDEILQCLKEGLQQYQPQDHNTNLGGANYEEVLDAVREGLQDFKPPAPIDSEASITREEILMTVRECLETFDFPKSQVGAPREQDITRDDVLDAVKEGLSAQAPISKEIEFNREDLFDAVKAGLQGTWTPMGGVGEQVLDKMEELLDGMRIEFKQYSEANGGDTEQVLDAMKDGLEVLRADIETYVDRAADVTGKDEIVDTIKHGLDQLRHDLEASISKNARSDSGNDSSEILDMMDKEFAHLRQTIASPVSRSESQGLGREEIIDVIREGLADLKSNLPRNADLDSNQTLGYMREEFAHLRETLASTLIQGGASSDREELLEAIREGHEALRVDFGTKRDRPESILSNTSELLDAFNDGLDTLRSDIEKMTNKPLDMTVNYEILETLKEGLAGVRADIDGLHAVHSANRGPSATRNGEVVVADPGVEGAHRNDMSHLEMMITQLRIKVEALDNMPPPPTTQPEGAVAKEHIDSLETLLRDVQASVADIVQREHTQSFTRDDLEAFETLLRNTKAKVDEMGSSDAEGLAKVSHFESLETTLIEMRDAIADLESDGASKKDIRVLEALLREVRAGLEELQEKGPGSRDGERVCKTDIEALETLCMDTKTQISELSLPDPDNVVSKAEIALLEELVRKLGEQAVEQHDLTAQAFEARKVEHGGIADKIEDVKLIFEDVREDLKAKIKEGHHSVNDLAQTLDTVAETLMAADNTATIAELRETVKTEFECNRGTAEGIKEHNEQNHAILLEKHSDHKNEIISELNTKLDARFDEIMTKYDDAQLAAREKQKTLNNKDAQQQEALTATKTAAEDLRILVDALGSTVTDSCDRMSEDSKTVFARVEDVGSKLEALLAVDGKVEHQATRAEISKTLTGVEGIQAHASEYHPQILDAVRDILGIVGQHYEQAKMSTEEIKSSVQAIPGAIPLPAIAPRPETPREVPSFEKYDDSAMHSKLDQLVAHATEAGKTAAEFAALEQIREQVAATATQLNEFVTAQRDATIELNNNKAKEAEEVAIAIEKRFAQKSIIESDIVRLSDQKGELDDDVQALKREKDDLSALKSKMQADLSSLETALQIRREELEVMEVRADGLERRILDGVLDHSRSLLTTSRPQSSLKEMNLKRVASTASNVTVTTRASKIGPTTSVAPGVVSNGVGIAMKRRQPPRTSATNSTSGKPDRRILSLSTIGPNKGAVNDRAMVLANPSITGGTTRASGIGAGGMKRSHSVKSNFPSRKSSWGGTKTPGGMMYADDDTEDKENSVLDEEDEDDLEGSEAGTERRTSYTGTYTTGTGSYGAGSTVSSDDYNKRASYAASSTVGTVGTRDLALSEDGDRDEEEVRGEDGRDDDGGLYLAKQAYENGDGSPKPAVGKQGEMIIFGQDSAIGSDLPTAMVEGGSDYFR